MDKTITLNPGESQQVSFQVTAPLSSGKYKVNLDGLSGYFSVVSKPGVDLVVGTYNQYTIHDINGIKFSQVVDFTPPSNWSGNMGTMPTAVLATPISLSDLTQGLIVNITFDGASNYYNTDSGGSQIALFLRFEPNFYTQIAPPVMVGVIGVPIVNGRWWNVPFNILVNCNQVWNAGRMVDGQVKGIFSAVFTPWNAGEYNWSPCRVMGIVLA